MDCASKRAVHAGQVVEFEIRDRFTGRGGIVALCVVCSEDIRALLAVGEGAPSRRPAATPRGKAAWPHWVYVGEREDAPRL
jgi:hypothetical protein